MFNVSSASGELLSQWQNPGDIFSLLLIIGGDVIQKAAARLAGVRIVGVHVNPVAFSFGWVAYGFMTLASVLGHEKLMPEAEIALKVIDCDTGYDRDNQSWVLSRLLRDREEGRIQEYEQQAAATPIPGSTGAISMVVDIFVADNHESPKPDRFWIFCWLVILAQHGLGIVAWKQYGSWSILMITVVGTLLAVSTASLPQWVAEKWPARRLQTDKVKPVALTRGNGHQYVMLVLCHENAWDLEDMASARPSDRPGTRWILGVFAVLWVIILITVTGIKMNTWFLIGVGGLGMLQNIFAAALPCSPAGLGLSLTAWPECPTIVGYQHVRAMKKGLMKNEWQSYTAHDPGMPGVASDAQTEYETKLGPRDVRDVMGVMMELEKYLPKAGASLLPTFFPNNVDYDPGFHFNREKNFWRYAATRV